MSTRKGEYEVYLLEVSGNPEIGWDLDDRHDVGSVMLTTDAPGEDVQRALIDCGLLSVDAKVDVEQYNISYCAVYNAKDGEPMYELFRKEK